MKAVKTVQTWRVSVSLIKNKNTVDEEYELALKLYK